jgi:hypothetical protein
MEITPSCVKNYRSSKKNRYSSYGYLIVTVKDVTSHFYEKSGNISCLTTYKNDLKEPLRF